jgi:hypothetical protein
VSNLLFKQPLNYILVTPTNELAISLAELKAYLKIPSSFTQEDAILTMMIKSTTMLFERITGRELINKAYRTYLDNFPYYENPYRPEGVTLLTLKYKDNGIIIRKSLLQSISSIKYYKNGILETWNSNDYYFSSDYDYSSVYIGESKKFPQIDERKQAIIIEFVAGYGANSTFVPEDIKLALFQMSAYLYENRGDCDCMNGLTSMAKTLLSSYVIINYDL